MTLTQTLSPLTADGPLIAVHAGAAVLALLVGPVAILRQRRDRLHRWAGWVWVVAMAVTAITAYGIFEIRLIGPFSPIHLLPVLVAVMIWRAVGAIRAGNRVAHARTMTQLYIWSLLVAGAFTLLPGRRMNAVLFGGDSWAGFGAAAVVLAVVAVVLWRAQPGGRASRPRNPSSQHRGASV
jgi:uncharacterized membrane protein